MEKIVSATVCFNGFLLELDGVQIKASGTLNDVGVLHVNLGGRRYTVTVIPVSYTHLTLPTSDLV